MTKDRWFDAKRLIAEALSVTAGVLLAFAVDAWWSRVEQSGDVEGLVEAARSEAAANAAVLVRARELGRSSLAAAGILVDEIGPGGSDLAVDSVARLFAALLTYGAAPLEHSATDRLLASGDLDALEDADFHRLLLRHRAAGRSYQVAGERFEIIHEGVITSFADHAPTSFLSTLRGVHAPTDFPVDLDRIMTSPDLEGAVGNLAVWTDNLNSRVDGLLALHDSVWSDRGGA